MKRLDYQILIILFVAGLLSGGAIAIGSATGVQDAQEGQTLEAAARSNIASILLYRRGAMVTNPEQDVVWLNPPAGELGPEDSMSTQTFLALAVPPGSNDRDLYRIDAKISPQGRLFDDSWIVNLTRTEGADDNQLTSSGTLVATVVSYAQKVTAIEIRDFAGEKSHEMGIENWNRLALLGNQITNLE
ncbi:MAG TPA: hypothetical protein EYN06_08415, partial [Myxococcales bacterium]|nr:hypothetical protein [Myxococcales bacterium]